MFNMEKCYGKKIIITIITLTSRDGDFDSCLLRIAAEKPGAMMGWDGPMLSSLFTDATSDMLGARSKLEWSSMK